MKMKIKNIIVGGVSSLLLVGCFNLDQYPHDSFANEDSFNTINDARFWMNGMYENLRGSTHGVYMTSPELQTDLIDISLGAFGGNIYTWEEFTASEPAVQNIWRKYYQNIANINNCIEGFNQIKLESEKEREELTLCKGELHLTRALYYSKLATLFCKSYDPATSKADLGLPLQKNFLVKHTDLPGRSSLEETYDFILQDITEAEKYLQGSQNEEGSQYMTSDAALLLKARMLLYKREWKQAYDVATSLIQSGSYPLVSSENALRRVWADDAKQETIVQLYASATERVDDGARNDSYTGEYVYTYQGTDYQTFTPAFLPNQWVLDLYEDTDIRKLAYYTQKRIRKGDTDDLKDLYLVYKYPGNPKLRTAKAAKAEHAPKIFRIAEAYLIAAEAAYMNNQADNATQYLNLLRTARKASNITVTGAELLEEIKKERVRELAYEGYRLMDLKRWKEGVDRTIRPAQDIDFIRNNPPEQYKMLKKSADDYRMVWPIPSAEIARMKNKLKQNSGW
ncbi:RagB/SusD family nutrient uptake outer membrane protein [Capnocytophaga stomatis]|uniref:RagB/SusD family nutrient uptake outer membrane protein n=1 Tax=Capnocytophaga stomatis TaxID=1848904 RepID=UPI001AC54693|nr:RagB/SusD family nutrient uptake outer membrane protein [Capnocytophaga stomatis]GIM48965.1 membrane protein [Capnocytophaga stomatis]